MFSSSRRFLQLCLLVLLPVFIPGVTLAGQDAGTTEVAGSIWATDFSLTTVDMEEIMPGGHVKVDPLQILIWHEIVNDEVGGVPLSVTFFPLCNTTLAFRRVFDGTILDFGTTGLLRHSDMERVVALEGGANPLAIPFSILREKRVVHVEVDGAGEDWVVFWAPGTASALDSQQISRGREWPR